MEVIVIGILWQQYEQQHKFKQFQQQQQLNQQLWVTIIVATLKPHEFVADGSCK